MSTVCFRLAPYLTCCTGRVCPGLRAAAGPAGRAVLAAALVLFAGAGRLSGAVVTFDAVAPQSGQESFRHLWNITLHNPMSDTTSVFFRVEARDAKAGVVFSASTPRIVLSPGDRRLAASEVKLTEVWCKKGYEAFSGPAVPLPEGDYSYVITLIPRLAQSAFFFRVRVPRRVELVWPPNGAVVTDSQPVLVWTPPEVSGPILPHRYELRVAELGPGQAALTAVRRSRPVFRESQVATTAFRVPSGTTFVPGRTYAWLVTATDTAGSPVDTVRTQSRAGTFVFRPTPSEAGTQTRFTFPGAGRAATGYTSLVVTSDVPDAELCVFEYSLASDSAVQEWHVIGHFPEARGSFVGMWASDSAVIRAGRTFPSPCLLRGTVLGRKAQRGQTEPLALVINQPPPPDRRGCGGCNQVPDE